MDRDLSSAERRWQRRALFHEQRSHRWRWLVLLMVFVTLLAAGWLAVQEIGLGPVVDHIGALYEGALHG